jgi:hypothetical protein
MVKIETEHGTYTGETVKDAQRAMRKGEKAAEKERLARHERYQLAKLRADAEAYRMLCRKAGNGFTKWELARRGDKWCHVQVSDADTSYPRDVVKFEIAEATDRCAVHNCGYSPKVLGVVTNAGGWSVGVFFQDSAGAVELYALGANADTLAFSLVPGVTMEDFPKRDE